MATGTNGIATVNDLVVGKGLNSPSGYASNQCPPKSVIVNNMGGSVPNTYASSQLVKYSDVSKAVSNYTLTLNISNMYSAVALFTASGTPSHTSSRYLQLMSDGPNVYKVIFTPGAGIDVNLPNSPGSRTTIYSGQQYSVWGQTGWGSFWSLIATLTHVNGNKTEYI